jgi:hypothetical protein
MRDQSAGHYGRLGKPNRTQAGLCIVSLWAAALAIAVLMSALLCSCNALDAEREVISTVRGNDFVIAVVKECEATAIGSCYYAVYEQSPFLRWFRQTEQLIRVREDCDGIDVRLLGDSLVLAGCTYSESSRIDPVIIVPIGLSEEPLWLDDRFSPGDLDRTNVEAGKEILSETYTVKGYPRQHVIHLTYNKLTAVTLNIYITQAESVVPVLKSDDMLEITVDWIGSRKPSVLMALLPGEGRQNMEIFVKGKSDTSQLPSADSVK